MKRRIISIILCFSLLFVIPLSTAAAQEPMEPALEENTYPFVLVRGMDFTGIYFDQGTPTERSAVNLDIGGIVKTLLRAGISGLATQNMDRAVDIILDYTQVMFGGIACDTNGNSVYEIDYYRYPDAISTYNNFPDSDENEYGIIKGAVEQFGGDNVYYFNYDWRMNPLDVADEIAIAIEKVKAETGAQKVNLVSASMGGVMSVAYTTKYGFENINKFITLSSAFYGAKVVSELFSGQFEFTPDSLYNYVSANLGSNPFMSFFFRFLKAAGVFNLVARFADSFFERYEERILNELIIDTFGNILSFWAIVLPENYDECIEYMFGDRQEEYADFIAKADELQAMMANRDDMLLDAAENGVDINIVTTYNLPLVPAYPSAVLSGDGGLETKYMSGGATVANYGEILSEEVLNNGSQYISPDKVIDASTCLFPDNTWFLKDGVHVGFHYGTEQQDFLFWLVGHEGPADIYSNSDYPQYIQVNKDFSLSPLIG